MNKDKPEVVNLSGLVWGTIAAIALFIFAMLIAPPSAYPASPCSASDFKLPIIDSRKPGSLQLDWPDKGCKITISNGFPGPRIDVPDSCKR